ncbi:FAD-dependent oxidoreductase (plasmid) [Agrobacterium deltaense]
MRVLVVGGGIFGASAAFSLAREGAEVIVADDSREGKATAAGAGIVCPWITAEERPEFYQLLRGGRLYYDELIPQLIEAGVSETGFKKVGGLAIAQNENEAAALERRIVPRVAEAPEAGGMSRLDDTTLKSLFPPLRQGLTAFHLPGGARVEARTVAAALFQAAKAKGAVIRSEPVSLSLDGNRVRARRGGEEIEFDRVLVTAGAWANEILTALGVKIPVTPQKGQIIHLRLEGVDTADWPVVRPEGAYYMLAFEKGRIVVGATRETSSGFDYRVTAAGQAEVLNFALSLAPGLANASLLETRIGFRPYRQAMKPIISAVSGIDNLLLGNGLGASGLTMGPIAGDLLARLALNLPVKFDLSHYRFESHEDAARIA